MEWVMLLLGAAVAVPVLSLIHRNSQRRERRINDAWEAAAKELAGDFVPRAKTPRMEEARVVRVEIDGVEVEVDHFTVDSGKGRINTFTRAVASADAPADFKLKVDQASVYSGIARAVGFQDVPTGDDEFDEAFVVKSSDPEAAQMWLNAAVRKQIWQASEYRFQLQKGKVQAVASGLMTHTSEVVAVAQATAAFADGRQRVFKQWRRLADKYGGKLSKREDGWATLEIDVDGVPVVVDTHKIRDKHFTFARAQVAGAKMEPFVIANDPHIYQSPLPKVEHDAVPEGYELWTRDVASAVGHFGESVVNMIAATKPAKLRAADGYVTVMWDGICTKRSVINNGIALAVEVAAGMGQGPYR
jgi:hypothetical protein